MSRHHMMHTYMFLVELAYMSIRCVREVVSKHADENHMDQDHTVSLSVQLCLMHKTGVCGYNW
jgi:hypothetical protein